MKIRKIVALLEAKVLSGEAFLDDEVQTACGSDMMSDVLAFCKDQAMLLTGLVNPQVIRTAMMLDMRCIVFVRNKQPSQDIVALAKENHIVVLTTKHRMYEACGMLYANGLGMISEEGLNNG